jgi:hypothetical protein
MKKPVEHHELLADVLAENEPGRAAILERGLAALRRTRMRRRAVRLTLAVVPLLVAVAVLVMQNRRGPTIRVAATPDTSGIPPAPARVAKTIEGTPIRVLTDEELLAFFKDRPVALLREPGHQRLILLDEAVQ